MKSDSVQFNTRKTLQQIIQVLNSFKCEIQSIQPDPFAQDKADIEVVMIGMATMADAAKQFGAGKAQWGVQVYVYDMGKYRSVELVALGESGFKYAMTTGRGQSALDSMISGRYFINMRHSKAYRDKIMRQLEPVTSGGSRSASDASKSRLYRAIDQQPAAESKELVSRIHSQMQTILSSFLRSHPDFSEPGLMTVPNGELRNHVAELRQITEDDAITGNDRSALYTLIYVLSVIETDKNTERFMALNLLDRVLKLENAGVNISEDMKIWPLFARYFDFTNWHEMKYGENGTSGKLNASDPAIEGAKGSASSAKAASLVGERAANAGTEAAAASGSTASEGTSGRSAGGKHAAGGGSGGSFNRKYLILGAAFLAVIILTAVIVNSINKAKYEDQAPAAAEDEYSEDVAETNGEESSDEQSAAAQDNDAVWHIYAHRGVGGEEETYASYDSAIEQGARYIEQDVILSGGELYVSYKYKEPQQLRDDGNLSLNSVFDMYGDTIHYVIEIKTRDMDTVNALADLIQTKGLEDNVEIQNFDYGSNLLSEVHNRLPNSDIVYLVDENHGGDKAFREALSRDFVDTVAVSYEEGMMDSEHCEAAHNAGKNFCVWVLDNENSIKEAIILGVDRYFTRYPGLALELENQYR